MFTKEIMKPKIGDDIEVYEDPMTTQIHEGLGKIVKIHNEHGGVLDCDVRFYNDYGHGLDHNDNGNLGTEIYRRQIKIS